jgi:predicted DCC family thiol-disulfide oxidoreductase YuxK
LRRRDTQGRFRIVPFQSAPPELLQCVSPNALRRGVHVITADGRVLRSGRAVLFIGEQLGYGWLTRPLSLPPMVWVVEGVYWVIARLRGKLSRWLRLSETECPR